MQPVIVMPMHDPNGMLFPHLAAITSTLQESFARAVVSLTRITYEKQSGAVEQLQKDAFFQVLVHERDVAIGEDFFALYTFAARSCQADQVLHLCFPDRVAYTLSSEYREAFQGDVQSLRAEQTPMLFQRSARAWETHPRNYRELEDMLTRTGALVLGKRLDLAWCHLALTAEQLGEILPDLRRRDLSMLAEMVLLLRETLQTRDVDWLAWEDPFILGREAQPLKAEREQSVAETRKRLDYVLPMLELLREVARVETQYFASLQPHSRKKT